MKSISIVASILTASALSLTPMIASANPADLVVDITCPTVNAVQNFGDYVAGYGNETIQGQNNHTVYFRSATLSDMPTSLMNYQNINTEYNSATGEVKCGFASAAPNEPRFSVSYVLTNGKGGTVLTNSPVQITLDLPVGLHGK